MKSFVLKWKCNTLLTFLVLPVIFLIKNVNAENYISKMNKIEAYKFPAIVYHKCLIYRVLCHWLRDRKIYIDISHISYIFYILKTSHTRLCQSILQSRYRNGSCAPVSICHTARTFILHQPEIFPYLFWVDFLSRALAEKFAERTKFEVKRHFTIRAGSTAGTRRIKFVFFPYQYLQNFSISDQNPGVAAYRR